MIEFIKAAKLVKEKYSNTYFDIVGPLDSKVEGSCNEILQKAQDNKIVEYYGATDDVSDWMGRCRYFVYPSYYPEGVPRCVLQALSSGRPVITCNTIGCKDTVIDGLNGFLVEPQNVEQLATKMIWMIEHPNQVKKMAMESRKLVEQKFDVDIVNEMLITALVN